MIAEAPYRLSSEGIARRFDRFAVIRSYLTRRWMERDAIRLRRIVDRWREESGYWKRDEPETIKIAETTFDPIEEQLNEYEKIETIIQTEGERLKEEEDIAACWRIKDRVEEIIQGCEAKAEARYKSKHHRAKMVNGLLAEDEEYQGLWEELMRLPQGIIGKVGGWRDWQPLWNHRGRAAKNHDYCGSRFT